MTIKRLFIAVDIKPEPELIDFFSTLKEGLDGEQIKWVDEGIFHLTLKFLGDTDTRKIETIKAVLAKITGGFQPVSCEVRGLGFFGSPRDPKVLFASIDGAEVLTKISRRINEELEFVGFEKEAKDFKPHLTLGRIKSLRHNTHFLELVKSNRNTFFQNSIISSVVLYESILRPQGPKYILLAEFGFGKLE